MSTTMILSIVVSLTVLVLCAGMAFFVFVLVLGIFLLRRRGKKVTAKDAMTTGVQAVSTVFRRDAEGNLVEVPRGQAESDEEEEEDEA